MKHGCGTKGAAPASDAAGRGDALGTPLPAHPTASRRVMPRGFHVFLADLRRRGSDLGRFTRNRFNSGLNQPYWPKRPIQAKIQKKKKKKGAKRTV